MSASLNKSPVPLSFFLFISLLWFCLLVSVVTLLLLLCDLSDVDAVEVVGSKRAVALGALPLSGVVTHLQTFVAENVETLGEHRLLVPRVTAGASQLGLKAEKHVC